MSDSAFRVLVLPKEGQGDISQFAAKLQEICNRVTNPKVNIEVNPATLATSLQTALTGRSFDITINTTNILTSLRAALSSQTFDINVNPVSGSGHTSSTRQGSTGSNAGNRGSSSGLTLSQLATRQAYLERLKTQWRSYSAGSNERTAVTGQIREWSRMLTADKVTYAESNNTSVRSINEAIKQTSTYVKAKNAASTASAKAQTAYEKEAASVGDMVDNYKKANAQLQTWNQVKGDTSTQAGAEANYLDSQGLLTEYQSALNKFQSAYAQTLAPGFSQQDIATRMQQMRAVVAAHGEMQKAQSAATAGAKKFSGEYQSIKSMSTQVQSYYNKLQSAGATVVEPDLMRRLGDLATQGQSGAYAKGLRQYSEEFKGIQYEAKSAGLEVETFGARIGRMFKDQLGYAFLGAAAAQAFQAVRQIYTNVVELDASLTQISIVTGTAGDALDSFADKASKVAQTVGSTTTAIISSTETYARLGYNLSDSLNLADVTARYANVAATDVDSATASLTSIMKSFNVAPEDMEGVVDMLVKVGQEYAISAGELGEAMQRGGAAMAAGGSSLEETIALFTAGNAAVQDASVVGREYCPAA